MNTFFWILTSGLLMGSIALIGSVTLILKPETLDRILVPLIAYAAGSLVGGAFLHMIPAGLAEYGNHIGFYLWILGGFTSFLALEQFLHQHHCHRANVDCKQPLTYLVLIGDGLHNFIGGIAIAGTFLIDIRLGIMSWLAAAAHEVPQEIGDFGVLVHGGWSKGRALLFNVLSALTFLLGGLLTYFASINFNTTFLVAFASGNFIYIAASDLVPEVNKHAGKRKNAIHFLSFLIGLAIMAALKFVF